MKKIARLFLITLIVMGCKRPALKTGLEGKPMPTITMLSLDSSSILSTTDILLGKPSILFYFSPECPYCRAQITDMIKHIDEIKECRVYMMTNFPLGETKQFCIDYNLNNHRNILVGIDDHFFFANYFRANGVPFTAVYGKDKKLKAAYIGPITIKDILTAATD